MATTVDNQPHSRDELKALVRELMEEILWEMEQQLPDPDEGLELRPEFAAILAAAKRDKEEGSRDLISHEEMKRRLGLNG
jgi:hypothetical protein